MSQLCYFDYAATTPVRGEVIAAMTAALEQFGNPSSRYPYGAQAAKRVKEDRATVAQALAAPRMRCSLPPAARRGTTGPSEKGWR